MGVLKSRFANVLKLNKFKYFTPQLNVGCGRDTQLQVIKNTLAGKGLTFR